MSIFDKQEWINAVNDLQEKAARFTSLFDNVNRSYPQTIELEARKTSLINKGVTLKNTIQKTTQAIDWAYARIDQLFGNDTDNTLESLGVIWFITVPVLAGVAATLTYLISDYSQYLNENAKIEQLQSDGYTLQESLDIVNRPTGIAAALQNGLKSYGPWIAGGLVAYLIIRG